MTINPVFVNELRQSPLRRKPCQALGIWIGVTLFLIFGAQSLSGFLGSFIAAPFAWLPMLALPIIVPAFASGSFAKEYEQQTWQDLYLTRLTNLQVVMGKFVAALLQAWLLALSFLPAIMVSLVQPGQQWAALPGWWTIVLAFKLLLSASLYVVLAMVCSRYSGNRRTALVWSYIALFLYAVLGTMVWTLVGEDAARADRITAQTSVSAYPYNAAASMQDQQADPLSRGFMQGIHLIFCAVVGGGCVLLLWVSMSEQRGYHSAGEMANRAWQPIGGKPSARSSV